VSIDYLGELVDGNMYPMTMSGLEEAIKALR